MDQIVLDPEIAGLEIVVLEMVVLESPEIPGPVNHFPETQNLLNLAAVVPAAV